MTCEELRATCEMYEQGSAADMSRATRAAVVGHVRKCTSCRQWVEMKGKEEIARNGGRNPEADRAVRELYAEDSLDPEYREIVGLKPCDAKTTEGSGNDRLRQQA